ncbi:hypothetical protein K504DRAFT_490678 [Pleomassaria siparia CBS 279.74]|uniref:Uncharacterized protein n=1 Tax=Pleomassaria siparia CBS 279.74 TaxID=1314801 RepID=A0A6G1KCI8_9PLEO|nr:hypothetical protein K504DRAFT_490678 [Pleomassaria siparia CBS 279.74]
MHYEKLLQLCLIPTYFSLVLCLVTAILITHYWILGDFFTTAYFTLISPSTKKQTDYYTDFVTSPTDAAIVSASTALMAMIIATIAWYKLRRSNMDMPENLPRRRFWVGSVCLTATANFCSAFAALVLHYTNKGPDSFGCHESTDASGFVIMSCTREMAACNFMPNMRDRFDQKFNAPWAIPLTCNEIMTVKWFQIIIMLNAIALFGMFALQSWVRRKTREDRMGIYSKKLMSHGEP